jgi:transcriptional regulator with PAS, ATPase and Fis domain
MRRSWKKWLRALSGAAVAETSRNGALAGMNSLALDRQPVGEPVDRETQSRLEPADASATRATRLRARVQFLSAAIDPRTGCRHVVGESAVWQQVLTQATQVASTPTSVLLLGESGTGKEVVARFIHRASSRDRGPFVALNCAALPDQLFEAELFGYERGAFTGATQSKPGVLEQASGGTLFLDEIGELSLAAQAKLLRVLQEREFQRLGGTRVQRTEARIVAATNRDLVRAVAAGQFREDLYYRLNVFPIFLPALRQRTDDILPLAGALLTAICREISRPLALLSSEARRALVAYGWPGNVRELRNSLQRAAILSDGGTIGPDHLLFCDAGVPATARSVTLSDTAIPAGDLPAMERAMIERALEQARFNKSQAARAVGLSRHQLYVRLRRHGLAS